VRAPLTKQAERATTGKPGQCQFRLNTMIPTRSSTPAFSDSFRGQLQQRSSPSAILTRLRTVSLYRMGTDNGVSVGFTIVRWIAP